MRPHSPACAPPASSAERRHTYDLRHGARSPGVLGSKSDDDSGRTDAMQARALTRRAILTGGTALAGLSLARRAPAAGPAARPPITVYKNPT